MVKILKRAPIKIGNIVRLFGLSDLQLLKTTNDNYERLSEYRLRSLDGYDDLYEEEIKDVLEF